MSTQINFRKEVNPNEKKKSWCENIIKQRTH